MKEIGLAEKEDRSPLVLRGYPLFCHYSAALGTSLRGSGSKIPATPCRINIPLNLHNTPTCLAYLDSHVALSCVCFFYLPSNYTNTPNSIIVTLNFLEHSHNKAPIFRTFRISSLKNFPIETLAISIKTIFYFPPSLQICSSYLFCKKISSKKRAMLETCTFDLSNVDVNEL